MALAWVMSQPGITSAICGASSEAQIRQNLMAADLALDSATKARIDQWFPVGRRALWKRVLGAVLRRVADVTGGRALISVGASQLRKAFANVADDLGHHYSIGYISTDETEDGLWREIEIEPVDPKLEVVARKGYYAPVPQRSR